MPRLKYGLQEFGRRNGQRISKLSKPSKRWSVNNLWWIMPKRIRNARHGIPTFVDQATLTLEDLHRNRREAAMEITKFNGPDSSFAFFGESERLRLIGERPHPRDYFKVFRADRYKDELRLLASTVPAQSEEWKEIKRDFYRGLCGQIAVEVSRPFLQTEKFAKRWLENKMSPQRCPCQGRRQICAHIGS